MRQTSPEFSDAKTISLAGRTFQFNWNNLAEDRAWDDFLLTLPDAHHEQASLWGGVRAALGWTVMRAVLTEDGKIIGGAQVQLQSVRRLGRWAYITFGPCLAGDDPLAGKILLGEIKKFLRRERALYLIAQLPYEAHHFAERLPGDGLIRAPRALAQGTMKATLVLDLKKSEEQLLAEMRATTRNQIRQGLQRGLTIEPGGAADIPVFWELMCALCARRKTPPNPASLEFFQQLWKRFSPRGWINLFLVKLDGKPVAAALAFPFGGWFRVWKVGWDGAHAERRPNHLMWWAMIRDARSRGFKHFDFVSINPGGADGATDFKLGFGGEVRMLPGAYCYFPNPLVRAASQIGLARLLDSKAGVKLAKKVRRR